MDTQYCGFKNTHTLCHVVVVSLHGKIRRICTLKKKSKIFQSTFKNYLNINLNHMGHCFRRTSASLLADSGGDIITLK